MSDKCTCENPSPETDIVTKGSGPEEVPVQKVTYCTDCNGGIEVEML